MTDTGSMEPIPDAVAWAVAADAWSQRSATPPDQQPGTWVEPANRWSDVAPTGRPTFPPDGVGWRSETSEWQAATETARWRQTTEWRSSSGTSGWRSTTEAWQTGGNAEGFRPPTDLPTRQPAISGTAWPTPNGDEQPWATQAAPPPPWQQDEPRQSWQQPEPTQPSWRQDEPRQRDEPVQQPWQRDEPRQQPWQRDEPRQSWQQPGETRQPWQSPGAEMWRTPPADPTPPWSSPEPSPPSTPTWQQADDTPSWRQADGTPSWRQSAARQSPAEPTPSWQQPAETPSWQQPAEPATPSRQGGSTPSRPSNVSTPSWQQTQSIPGGPAAGTPSWQQGAGTPSWQQAPSTPSWQTPQTPERPQTTGSGPYAGAWSVPAGYDEGQHLVREDDRAQWRRESAAGLHGVDDRPRRVGRRRAPETDAPQPGGGTGWAVQSESDNWAGHTDTGTMPVFRDSEEQGGSTWRRAISDAPATDSWRTRSEPDSDSWNADEPRTDSWRRGTQSRSDAPSWRDAGPETGTWRRETEPAADPWARSAADTGVGPLAWQAPADTGTGSWRPEDRQRIVPLDDPDQIAPRSGAGTWQAPPRTGRRAAPEPVDPEVWRQPPVAPEVRQPEEEPPAPAWRHGAQEDDRTQSWRRELQDELRRQGSEPIPGADPTRPAAPMRSTDLVRPADPVRPVDTGNDVTQIRPLPEPAEWQREQREQAARGTASYREGNTEDWRRQLAEQADLADGESRRFGTSDFVPFRPPGAAAAPERPARATASAGVPVAAEPTTGSRPREELLVGSRPGGGSWQDPPDTQWPPQRAGGATTGSMQRVSAGIAGPYERRPVSTMPEPSGRQRSLLEPDEDLDEEDPGGPLAAVGFTVVWYGVPVVLFVLYMLVLDGAQQSHALSTLAGAAPQFGLSLVLSMAVAVGLRWASGSWKAASVGLAAAVMGGGLATVLSSAITGQSLS